jgi:hypothetical protein
MITITNYLNHWAEAIVFWDLSIDTKHSSFLRIQLSGLVVLGA